MGLGALIALCVLAGLLGSHVDLVLRGAPLLAVPLCAVIGGTVLSRTWRSRLAVAAVLTIALTVVCTETSSHIHGLMERRACAAFRKFGSAASFKVAFYEFRFRPVETRDDERPQTQYLGAFVAPNCWYRVSLDKEGQSIRAMCHD